MPIETDHEESDAAAEPVSQSDALVKLGCERYEFGRSVDGELYAVRKNEASFAYRLAGRQSLRSELAHEFYDVYGRPPSGSALKDAITVIEGIAQRSTPRTVHLRVAQRRGRTYLDLADRNGHVVVAGSEGWEVRTGGLVRFWRSELTGPLPMPREGVGARRVPHLLGALLNFTESNLALCIAWIISTFFPSVEHPILLILGVQGTGKTTAERIIAGTVDPSPAQTWTAPARAEDWIVAASHAYVVPLDNISTIAPWLSDALCQASTGGAWVARRRYTDRDVYLISFKRAVIIDGIDAGALRGDLADRVVAIELDEIPASARTRERVLTRRFQRMQPELLGALLDLLVEVHAVLPTIRLEEYPRMADFAKIAAAVDQVLGTNAFETYMGSRGQLAQVVVEGDRVATAVVQFMERRETNPTELTAQELLDRITPNTPDQYWPRTPRGLVAALKRVLVPLREVGVDIAFHREAGGSRPRIITLTRTYED